MRSPVGTPRRKKKHMKRREKRVRLEEAFEAGWEAFEAATAEARAAAETGETAAAGGEAGAAEEERRSTARQAARAKEEDVATYLHAKATRSLRSTHASTVRSLRAQAKIEGADTYGVPAQPGQWAPYGGERERIPGRDRAPGGRLPALEPRYGDRVSGLETCPASLRRDYLTLRYGDLRGLVPRKDDLVAYRDQAKRMGVAQEDRGKYFQAFRARNLGRNGNDPATKSVFTTYRYEAKGHVKARVDLHESLAEKQDRTRPEEVRMTQAAGEIRAWIQAVSERLERHAHPLSREVRASHPYPETEAGEAAASLGRTMKHEIHLRRPQAKGRACEARPPGDGWVGRIHPEEPRGPPGPHPDIPPRFEPGVYPGNQPRFEPGYHPEFPPRFPSEAPFRFPPRVQAVPTRVGGKFLAPHPGPRDGGLLGEEELTLEAREAMEARRTKPETGPTTSRQPSPSPEERRERRPWPTGSESRFLSQRDTQGDTQRDPHARMEGGEPGAFPEGERRRRREGCAEAPVETYGRWGSLLRARRLRWKRRRRARVRRAQFPR